MKMPNVVMAVVVVLLTLGVVGFIMVDMSYYPLG